MSSFHFGVSGQFRASRINIPHNAWNFFCEAILSNEDGNVSSSCEKNSREKFPIIEFASRKGEFGLIRLFADEL
ncbi:uncharacterized protein Gasu_03870 [Galdieria sulphuraria]|uniref:Uncharacterized protein n=1 Tax=Galdieria sulphuraria TaxID=130081 RepID=M2Y9R6_GALSU|nr:uncharacterized protein Gasu_03870 [Galdieria sulphuraria]EME32619.1 hypothetical protein Gasu_03870 [Galdieria sulphuraria]|eukprot:XP_005709139.1 hypothetical protein Gasu_03870 [Galdieria sulphuraria]